MSSMLSAEVVVFDNDEQASSHSSRSCGRRSSLYLSSASRPLAPQALPPSPASAMSSSSGRAGSSSSKQWTIPAIVVTAPSSSTSMPLLVPSSCARPQPTRATGWQLAGRGGGVLDDNDDEERRSSAGSPQRRPSFAHLFRRFALGAAARQQCRRRCAAAAAADAARASSWEHDLEAKPLRPRGIDGQDNECEEEESESEESELEDEDSEWRLTRGGGGFWGRPEPVPEPEMLHAHYQPKPFKPTRDDEVLVAGVPQQQQRIASIVADVAAEDQDQDDDEEARADSPLLRLNIATGGFAKQPLQASPSSPTITALASIMLATAAHMLHAPLVRPPHAYKSAHRGSSRRGRSSSSNTLSLLTTARLVLCLPVFIVLVHIYLSTATTTAAFWGISGGEEEIGSGTVRAIDALQGELLGAAW